MPKSRKSLTKLTPELITKILIIIIKKSSSVLILAVQSKVPIDDGVKISPILLCSFDLIINFLRSFNMSPLGSFKPKSIFKLFLLVEHSLIIKFLNKIYQFLQKNKNYLKTLFVGLNRLKENIHVSSIEI